VRFAAITLCVASRRVFIINVYFVIDSGRKLSDTPSYYDLFDDSHSCHFLIFSFIYIYSEAKILVMIMMAVKHRRNENYRHKQTFYESVTKFTK